MSGKAADVHHKTVPDLQPQKPRHRQQQAGRQVANSATNEPLSRDDFLNMQREVQQVGKHSAGAIQGLISMHSDFATT